MTLWPWWLGALGLAGAALAHLVILRRPIGVSGALNTALDPVAARSEHDLASFDDAALEAALIEAARAEFGDAAVDAAAPLPASTVVSTPPLGFRGSVLFLVGCVLGGTVFALISPTGFAFESVPGGVYARIFGDAVWPALFVGGVLVGVGTSMAGGCTSGHGLVGCGRLQVPSLIATACFFGTGIVLSLAVKALVLS
ncbi:MAG: YeeE/YedE thiosulfate transporter family protein [Deltaproteobacteria bacterium]|nr:YeeE/YedE thiosulfate transporter family protein [Deltaproteobacteria bacterium]